MKNGGLPGHPKRSLFSSGIAARRDRVNESTNADAMLTLAHDTAQLPPCIESKNIHPGLYVFIRYAQRFEAIKNASIIH